jgi:serine protease AprX
VVAAGNGGPTAGTVTAPGSDPFVITVGSFGDQGTVAPSDDIESTFSGRGPTLDGFAKPDTLAPGEHVQSLRVAGVSYLDASGNPVGSATDKYVHMTGTSAAAAFVSGVAALVAAQRKHVSPTQVKGAIVASGRAVSGSVTMAVDAPTALVRTTAVNVGLHPSQLLLQILMLSRALKVKGVTWEGVTWEGVTWDGITWDGVTWHGVTWNGVTWNGVTWEGLTWESINWDGVNWETVSWETVSWEGVTWSKVKAK